MSSVSSEIGRNGFPESMVFQNTWRSYQARVLEHLDSYLDDKRVHIVAAPGSGKTVLGLEIIRRIDQPTLVLAPTITIRDQWVDRLVGLFLPAGRSRPSWISTELRKPARLTIVTYQALHCLCSGEIDKELENISEEEHHNRAQEHADGDPKDQVGPVVQFPEVLAQAGFRTLAVDEAHHLRAEWWKTLKFVAEHLNKPTIVALTATPPYDVSPFVERSTLRCLSPNSFSLVICVLIKITSTSVCRPKGNKEFSLNSGRRLIRSFSGYAQIRGSQQL